jgi:hypothetical protein
MKNRCYNPNSTGYKNYGGRGIQVHTRWRNSFRAFLADMGPRPPGCSLDRFPDLHGDYAPGNCRWATRAQQSRNTRRNRLLWFEGSWQHITDLSRRFGVSAGCIAARLHSGWSVYAAVTVPAGRRRPSRLISLGGEVKSLSDWARQTGLSPTTISKRLAAGDTPARAMRPADTTRKLRRYSFNGKNQTLAEWAAEVAIPVATLKGRLQMGWTFARVVTTPVHAPRATTHWVVLDGQRYSLTDAAKMLGLTRAGVRYRVKHGLPLTQGSPPALTR